MLTWVLIGLGLRNLSMAPRQIPVVKSIVRATRLPDAERLLAQALTMATETEIEELVYSAHEEALPARARRRRRGTLGGVSAGGPAVRVRVRRARRDDWPAARELLREVDDLHAALAPAYFRSAPRGDEEWSRLLEEDNGAVFVAEPPAARRRGRRAGGAHLRHAGQPGDGAAAPAPHRDRRRLRQAPPPGHRPPAHGRRRRVGTRATAPSRWC